ncbi:FRG domain-containing protein [Leuconostoc pseudomesenteroides]|uniref:FRG domain-containing protein n=1 Tax=Leuconostoc pseudomesenteroides TaxID=33968 RepID=UPI001666FDEF|nr:FRG domain-containing protein [Leuconostoc pseudomesenteroides]
MNENDLLMNILGEVNECISDFQNKIKHINPKVHPLFAFRGEPCIYPTALLPSLFREEKDIKKETYLLDLLSDFGIIENKQDSDLERAISSQHYVALSRLLDISFSALVGIYFACSSDNTESNCSDGVLYVFSFPEYYSPSSQYVQEYYSNLLSEKKYMSIPDNFKVISHANMNPRIIAQKGGFIFFSGDSYHEIDSCYYKKITIRGNQKLKILKTLDTVFNINSSTIYPEKENQRQAIQDKLGDFNSSAFNKPDASSLFEKELSQLIDRFIYEKSYNNLCTDKKWMHRQLRELKNEVSFYVENYRRKLLNEGQKNFLYFDNIKCSSEVDKLKKKFFNKIEFISEEL